MIELFLVGQLRTDEDTHSQRSLEVNQPNNQSNNLVEKLQFTCNRDFGSEPTIFC